MGHFCMWMALIVLVFYLDTVLSDPITVVLVAEKDDSVVKPAVRNGIEQDEDAEPKFKLEMVLIDNTMKTEVDICQNIFAGGRAPQLVIDATQEMNGSMPTIAKRSQLLKSLLRKMGAPTVSLTPTLFAWPGPTLTDIEKQYIISFIPPNLVISNVVKSVGDIIEAKKIGVVYDQTFPFTNKAGLLFDNIPSEIAMMPLNANIMSTIRQINVSDLGNIFVFASENNLNALLELVVKEGMYGKLYAWFAISKDASDLKVMVENEFTVLHIKPIAVDLTMEKSLGNYASDAKVDSGFYYDLSSILRQFLLENVGKEGSSWPATLTYPECGNEIALSEEMQAERASIKMRSWIEELESNKGLKGTFGDFTLKPNHPRGTHGYQNIKMEITKLTLSDKNPVKKPELFWQYKGDAKPKELFSGSTEAVKNHKAALVVRITTVVEPPFMYKQVVNGQVTWVGYLIDLIDAVKKEANLTFEYRITENKDKIHGNMIELPNQNITWNGMIGDIVQGKADIALGAIAVMAERELFVDFTVPYYDMVGFSILMKRNKEETELFKFLTVLENNVWACILAAYFFTSFLMFIFDRLSPYSFHNNQEKFKDDDETRDFSLKESLWFCITSLTPQGGGEAPRNLSGRLVAATWWLFGFIIIASYTANLAAFLTVSRLDSTIESLDDLSRQYKIKYATVKDSAAFVYFERMSKIEERFYEIWKNMSLDDTLNETERAKLAVWDYPVSDKFTKIMWTMVESKFFKNLEHGINETRKSSKSDGYALLAEATQVQYATLQYCDLRQVGNQFSRKPLALALPKGSALKEPLSNAILKLLNERVLEQIKDKWWNKNPFLKKCYHYVKRNDGIAFDNIGGIFIVMALGIVMSLVSLAIEFIYFKSSQSNSRVITVKDYSKSPTGLPIRELKR